MMKRKLRLDVVICVVFIVFFLVVGGVFLYVKIVLGLFFNFCYLSLVYGWLVFRLEVVLVFLN